VSQDSNKGGYFPAEFDEERCTGCANCAIICPEAVIEIYKDETVVASAELKPEEQGGQRITEIRPKQKKSALTKERT
jgi:Fe-S-cluster-containing hydrogenase component 2